MATDKQRVLLKRFLNLSDEDIDKLDTKQASKLIDDYNNKKFASKQQVKCDIVIGKKIYYKDAVKQAGAKELTSELVDEYTEKGYTIYF